MNAKTDNPTTAGPVQGCSDAATLAAKHANKKPFEPSPRRETPHTPFGKKPKTLETIVEGTEGATAIVDALNRVKCLEEENARIAHELNDLQKSHGDSFTAKERQEYNQWLKDHPDPNGPDLNLTEEEEEEMESEEEMDPEEDIDTGSSHSSEEQELSHSQLLKPSSKRDSPTDYSYPRTLSLQLYCKHCKRARNVFATLLFNWNEPQQPDNYTSKVTWNCVGKPQCLACCKSLSEDNFTRGCKTVEELVNKRVTTQLRKKHASGDQSSGMSGPLTILAIETILKPYMIAFDPANQ